MSQNIFFLKRSYSQQEIHMDRIGYLYYYDVMVTLCFPAEKNKQTNKQKQTNKSVFEIVDFQDIFAFETMQFSSNSNFIF